MATAAPVSVRTKTESRSFYRPELDVLRFFAFLGVFLFHFNHPLEFYVAHGIPRSIAVAATSLIEGGVFGVDLFFALSAYLITELLLREKDLRGSLDVKGFYLRRILRIWPLYFFYIGLALIPVFNPNHVFTWRVCGSLSFAGRELGSHCVGLADSLDHRTIVDRLNRRAVLSHVAPNCAESVSQGGNRCGDLHVSAFEWGSGHHDSSAWRDEFCLVQYAMPARSNCSGNSRGCIIERRDAGYFS